MASLGEPHSSIGEYDGTIRVVEDYCKYDPLPFMLTVTNKAIKENPDAVVAYLRGWLRAVKFLKEEPQKAAAVYVEEQKSLGREIPVAVIDKALQRMKWEPDLTPTLEKYLVDQAKDLVRAPAKAASTPCPTSRRPSTAICWPGPRRGALAPATGETAGRRSSRRSPRRPRAGAGRATPARRGDSRE